MNKRILTLLLISNFLSIYVLASPSGAITRRSASRPRQAESERQKREYDTLGGLVGVHKTAGRRPRGQIRRGAIELIQALERKNNLLLELYGLSLNANSALLTQAVAAGVHQQQEVQSNFEVAQQEALQPGNDDSSECISD